MTTRRPPRGRSTAQHLAEIHRQLQRNDRRMARLARTLETLFDFLRKRHGASMLETTDLRAIAPDDLSSEL